LFSRCVFLFVLLALHDGYASPTFASGVTNGIVSISGLSEASGVAASRNNANVLWTHNDSGHPAVVLAIDTQGRLLGTYTLPGNTDNEDIAIGPGPVAGVSYLYVGDIGDNSAARSSIKIYQIPEPMIYARQYTNPVTAALKGARTITLTYPDGARDAEAMFVDSATGDLFILSKETTSRIYTAPKSQLDTNDNFALTFVRTLAFTVPDAADISPSGNEIIVRRESFAQLWSRAPGQTISSAFGGTATTIPVIGTANGEPNGEAIGFDSAGSGYFTLSDDATTQPLYYFARMGLDGPAALPQTLAPAGSSWRFLDNGSNQVTTWRNPGFNDSSWSNGVAQFGYGDGDEQTTVSFGGNANNKQVTTWFRKQFMVDDVADMAGLTLKLLVDDGAAVFLNGSPVVYFQLATNAAFNTLATATQPDALEDAWFSFAVDPRLLVNGTNTLAAEIHQASVISSDISFDLQLLGAAQTNAHEPFNYPAGTSLVLVTNAAGQWWSAAGSGSSNATVIAGNLSVTGLSSPTGAAMQFGAVDGPSARFNLRSNVTNGTLYFSFPIQLTSLGALNATGGYIAGFNNSRGTQAGTPTVLGIRILTRSAGAGGFNYGVAKNTTNVTEWVWATNVFSANQTVFLAGSYTFKTNSTTDDVSALWISPSASDFGSNQPPMPTLTATNGADIASDQIVSFVFLQRGLNNTNQPGAMMVDELRIGTNWASVTPRGIVPPNLLAANSGSHAVLSWPLINGGFTLETMTALGATNVWTEVSAPIFIAGDRFTVTNVVGTGMNFFRLRRSQ